MKRLAVLLTLALLPAPLVADAQQVAKVPRVGYVFGLPSSESRHLLEAFRQGLRELGYVEGQNVTLEGRWADGRSARLAPTPRIDSLADEGLKLLNFNVEAQCTPSRAALMTGRYAIRTGNASVPLGVGLYGLTQWEYTMAEMLSDAGYATGMFGKCHLGDSPGRYPSDQGFDEWFGIPNSSDESTQRLGHSALHRHEPPGSQCDLWRRSGSA